LVYTIYEEKTMKLLGKKVSGRVSYMDLLGAGVVKYAEERALAPYVGNGTLKSGLIKLGVGVGARKFLGKGTFGDSVSLGFGIDGVEDILTGVLGTGMIPGLGGARQGDNW
jgi:hypothetical protein